MIHGHLLRLARLIVPGAVLVAGTLMLVPASALAAGPATQCAGSLKRAPTGNDPNALDYAFQCNWGITAYSITATRQPGDSSTIDDFDPDGLGYDTSGDPAPGIDFTCGGGIPGNGINCGLSSGYLAAPDFVEGWIDTSEPYCARIPRGSKRALPQAIVQLIVTDTNGAEAGPFRLNVSPGCHPVPKPRPAKRRSRKKS